MFKDVFFKFFYALIVALIVVCFNCGRSKLCGFILSVKFFGVFQNLEKLSNLIIETVVLLVELVLNEYEAKLCLIFQT